MVPTPPAKPSAPSPVGPRWSQAMERQLRGKLVAHYFSLTCDAAVILFLGNSFVSWVFYLHYMDLDILKWGVVAVSVAFIRVGLAVGYRIHHGRHTPQFWQRLVFLQAIPISLVHITGLWILFQPGAHMYNAMLVLWYGIVLTGAVVHAAAMRWTMVCIAVFVGGGLVVRLAIVGEPAYQLSAVAVALFVVAQMLVGVRAHAMHVAALKQSIINTELAARWRDQMRIAVQASEQAASASMEKSRFLAAATHDLRQPLHALALSATALQYKLAGTAQHDEIEQVTRSVAELNESLHALLDLSRLDAGALQPRLEPVALSDVCASLHRIFVERANAKQLALRLHTGGLAVEADRQMLTRLLGNLVDNAIKYTPPGGGVLVSAQKRRCAAGDRVVIKVRDSGIGVPAALHASIFEEFYQVENPGRVRSQGLGLGLSIVKRLAHLMRLELTFDSQPGCGTCVELVVPLADGGGGGGPAPPQSIWPPDCDLRGRHLLVVDNEAHVVAATRAVLQPHGARITPASSAEEACAFAQSVRFDLALLDYRLGGNVNGLQLAGQLQACDPQLPIIVVTGDTSSQEIAALRWAGVRVHFKPLRGDQLVSIVAEALASGGRWPVRLMDPPGTGAAG